MKKFSAILGKFKGLLIFLFATVAIPALIISSAFLYLKYIGPISSTLIAGVASSALTKNLGMAIHIDEIEMLCEQNAVKIAFNGLQLQQGGVIANVPYIKAEIDFFKAVKGNMINAISDIGIASDITIVTHNVPSNIIVKNRPDSFVVNLKNNVFTEDTLSMLSRVLDGIKIIIRDHKERYVTSLVFKDINLQLLNSDSDANQTLRCEGLLHIGSDITNFFISIDVNDKNKLYVNGAVDGVPIALLWAHTGYYDKIDSAINISLNFAAIIEKGALYTYEFRAKSDHGIIKKNEYLERDIIADKVILNGAWNPQNGLLLNLQLLANELYIESEINYNDDKLAGGINIKPISVSDCLAYWPKFLLHDTRAWLVDHLKDGMLDVDAVLNFDLGRIKKGEITDDAFAVNVKISKTSLSYMPEHFNVPKVYVSSGDVFINAKQLRVSLDDAVIAGTKSKEATGVINYKDENVSLSLYAVLHGPAQDVINIGYAHANLKNDTLLKFHGDANTIINMTIPLDEQFVLNADNSHIRSQFSNVVNKDFLGFISASRFNIDCDMLGTQLKLRAHGLVKDAIITDIAIDKDISDDDEMKIHLKFESSIADLRKYNIISSDWANGKLKGDATISMLNDAYEVNTSVDLKNVYFYHPIGIEKKANDDGGLKLYLKKSYKNEYWQIVKYQITAGNFASTGVGLIDDARLIELSSDNSMLNNTKFNMSYKAIDGNNIAIDVNGDSINLENIDLARLLKMNKNSDSKLEFFDLNVRFRDVMLRKKHHLSDVNVIFQCRNGKCNEFRLSGLFDNNDKINIFYSYPVVSFVSSHFGEVLNSFGLYDRMTNGDIEFKGVFDKDETFKGNLVVRDFYLTKAPLLAKLFAPLISFQGLSDVLGKNGVHFIKMQSGIGYHNNKIFINDLSMDGPFVKIKCVSTVDVQTSTVLGEGVMIPSHVVNTATKNIPLLGKIISGGDDGGLIATTFSLNGNVENISIVLNPLSIMAPGFLGNFFNRMSYFKKHQKFPVMTE